MAGLAAVQAARGLGAAVEAYDVRPTAYLWQYLDLGLVSLVGSQAGNGNGNRKTKSPGPGLPLVVLPDSALHTEPRPSVGTPVVLWPERQPPPALNKRGRALGFFFVFVFSPSSCFLFSRDLHRHFVFMSTAERAGHSSSNRT